MSEIQISWSTRKVVATPFVLNALLTEELSVLTPRSHFVDTISPSLSSNQFQRWHPKYLKLRIVICMICINGLDTRGQNMKYLKSFVKSYFASFAVVDSCLPIWSWISCHNNLTQNVFLFENKWNIICTFWMRRGPKL